MTHPFTIDHQSINKIKKNSTHTGTIIFIQIKLFVEIEIMIFKQKIFPILHHSIIGQQQLRLFKQTCRLNRIENVLIIGSGLMGSGIAQSCATSGHFNSITLQDVSDQQLNVARKNIEKSLSKLLEKKKINIDNNVEKTVARIHFSTEMKPMDDKNLLIIEAIPELLEAKQNLFKNLWFDF